LGASLRVGLSACIFFAPVSALLQGMKVCAKKDTTAIPCARSNFKNVLFKTQDKQIIITLNQQKHRPLLNDAFYNFYSLIY